MVDPLVVDANAMISALLGGAAREALFSRKFVFCSAQHTLFEVTTCPACPSSAPPTCSPW